MKNIYIYCEGQTEEAFIKEILIPYLMPFGLNLVPIICSTKVTPLAKSRGGISDYRKISKELKCLCRQHKNEYVTT